MNFDLILRGNYKNSSRKRTHPHCYRALCFNKTHRIRGKFFPFQLKKKIGTGEWQNEGAPVKLTGAEDDPWVASWSDLPKYASVTSGTGEAAQTTNGVAIQYQVVESSAKAEDVDLKTADAAAVTIGTDNTGAVTLINTIPERWLGENSLSGSKPGGVYLELASTPFGAEKDTVEQHGICYLDGKGLPGRFCPQAAAEAMKLCMDAT